METVKIKEASIVTNKEGEKLIKIAFPFDLDTLQQVRSIPGRKYHPEEKCWSAPLFEDTVHKLNHWGFTLHSSLLSFLQETQTKTENIAGINGIPGLGGELFPFQKKGVAFIEHNKGRALIADEMGLGKTVQALAWLQLNPKIRPAIIVVPAVVKLKWAKEAEKWLDEPNVEVLSGTTPWKITGDIVIINYDILFEWIQELRVIQPKVLITDECHYYKSNRAKRTRAIKSIGKRVPHVIALSGTPIVNRPIEAYNAIRLINPNLFGDAWRFAKRYCGAVHNGYGWDFNGATNVNELHQMLTGSIMLRRLKTEVLKDLPEKTKSIVPLSLDNPSDYYKAESNFIEFVKETRGNEAARKASNAEALTQIEVLKQEAVKGKLPQAVEWIKDFLELTEEKLVVFATHQIVIKALMDSFSSVAVKIDGSVSSTERQKAVDSFQNDPKTRLFIGNIRAAGVGIDLTAASNVAILELPWTPGDLSQAEDRCHRIGQKGAVIVHYLLANGTIEERIAYLLDKKKKVLDAVLDGKITEQESLLTELIKQYETL